MRSIIILSIVALSACTSQAQEAQETYEMVVRQSENDLYKYKVRCPQARAVEAAYLAEKNEAEYKRWKLMADVDCGLSDVAA